MVRRKTNENKDRIFFLSIIYMRKTWVLSNRIFLQCNNNLKFHHQNRNEDHVQMNDLHDKNLEEMLVQEVVIVNHHHQAAVYDNLNYIISFGFYLDNGHEDGNGSMDDDDEDASASDRSSRGSSSMKQAASVRWDYRVNKESLIFFS